MHELVSTFSNRSEVSATNEYVSFSNRSEASVMDELVISLQEKLETVAPLPTRACIFKVPIALRKVHEEAYTPQVVSIGPYHCGNERLKPMEEHKLRYLSDFFRRRPKNSLEVFIKHLRELEAHARQCYGQNIKEKSDAFVEMMLLDGCFIIELFLKYVDQRKDVLERDPLFHIASMIPSIRVDMLLLENQLPLFILEHIFILCGDGGIFDYPHFLELALNFFNFRHLLSMADDTNLTVGSQEVEHFLDLLRECYIPQRKLRLSMLQEHLKVIPTASELRKAGVKFKRARGSSIFDLQFTQGTLEMPALILEDTTELLFRNLVAFEQCAKNSRNQYITHYLVLMDFLINSPNDVATLRHAGIIENWLGDDEQVSELFNKIFMGVTVFAGSFYVNEVTEKVNAYYQTRWHSFRAMLGRDYFYSPWSTASSIAVIIVVLCTIVQAVGSVFSMVKGK
ncbi:hypothetical protein ACHQM5_028333 [Ranunculus cassubicifolius]